MTALTNAFWAKILIDQLIQQGHDYFCISPGSRSTPLALAIAEHPLAKKAIHFDERSSGFHAVGYSKGAKKAAVVITTSGTAAGNLLPAVMEAHNDRIPLLVLTADRPQELRECGANQTGDQLKLFSNYVRWQFEIPCPTTEVHERFLVTTIAQASVSARTGPVHLNCPFREPLMTLQEGPDAHIPAMDLSLPESTLSPSNLDKIALLLDKGNRGIILAGSSSEEMGEELILLANHLKWPILPDILSPLRNKGRREGVIAYYDALLKVVDLLQPEIVLHVGDRLVSKTMQDWLRHLNPPHYLQVTSHSIRQDPNHQVTHRIFSPIAPFCCAMLQQVAEKKEMDWWNTWKAYSQRIEEKLPPFFTSQTHLSEPGIVHSLQEWHPPQWALFLANSMPVRDMDQFYFPQQETGPTFCNRGMSGIDGNISTAIGIAQGSKKPTLALLGDLAFLHDINALAQLRTTPYPVLVVVINNGGGGIFSFLPIAQHKDSFEDFFATAHPYTFEKAAELFHLPYFCPQDLPSWEKILISHLQKPQSALVEIRTNREENFTFHQTITAHVRQCLSLSEATSITPLLSSSTVS